MVANHRELVLDLADEGERTLAAQAGGADLPPPTLVLLGRALFVIDETSRAVQWLRQARRRHPGDFWLNHDLGAVLSIQNPAERGEAVRYLTAAVALYPDSAGAHFNLAGALRKNGQLDEAIAECREALRLKKDFPGVHNNLGIMLANKGRLEEAIAEYRAALRLNKDDTAAHYNLGLALRDKGQLEEAIAEFRAALRLIKDYAGAHNNLGIMLANKGRLEEAIAEGHNNLGIVLANNGQLAEAIAEYRAALKLKKNYAFAHNNLGIALRDKGSRNEAIAEFREAIRLNKDYALAHYNLGITLMIQEQFAEALTELRKAHELGSRQPGWGHPSARWVRDAQRLVELGGKLPAILRGEAKPADATQRIALANLCAIKNLPGTAARFFAEAFAAQPALAEDMKTDNRYNAACVAALAGCGQGQDMPPLKEESRARWRKQALAWLRADLAAWTKQRDSGKPEAQAEVRQTLEHWQRDPDLAGLREEAALAKLPEEERKACRQLWAEVQTLLKPAKR